ncbi:MAG: hypothetical protein U1F42_07075 [Candidatus Competibacteraceae bacterium]
MMSDCAGCSGLVVAGGLLGGSSEAGISAGGLAGSAGGLLSATGGVAAGLDVPERLEVCADPPSALSAEGLEGSVLSRGKLLGSTALALPGLVAGGTEE